MEDDKKLEKKLLDYCESNNENIGLIYDTYISLTEEIKLVNTSIWGKEQFSAMMMLAEQQHASLMERMELELERNEVDPFSSIKIATYIVGTNENGAIALLYFRTLEKSVFAMKLLPADILENPDSLTEDSVGSIGFEDD